MKHFLLFTFDKIEKFYQKNASNKLIELREQPTEIIEWTSHLIQGSCANFGIQNPDFILTKNSVFPDFQKPINGPETGFGLKTLPYMGFFLVNDPQAPSLKKN